MARTSFLIALLAGLALAQHPRSTDTTPPCTEGVCWYILETPVEASREQLDAFHARMGDNARPVQPLYERKVIAHH